MAKESGAYADRIKKLDKEIEGKLAQRDKIREKRRVEIGKIAEHVGLDKWSNAKLNKAFKALAEQDKPTS